MNSCLQALMKQRSFRDVIKLLDGHQTYVEAYASFYQTTNVPSSLGNDIFNLQNNQVDLQPEEVNFCFTIFSCVTSGAHSKKYFQRVL